MKVLLGDLLDVTTLQRGKLRLRMATVTARAIAEAAVESTLPLMRRDRHVLDLDIGSGDLAVRGDAIRLTQVLANLLANAAKYTPQDGRIALSIRREGAGVVFEVSDNGIGMEPATVSAMFDMFTQGTHTQARAAGGLGIGLALVRNIVELHGGRVRGESEGSGRGSRFSVHLPVSEVAVPQRPAVAVPVRKAQPDFPAAHRTIVRLLLADDNEDALWSMARMLSLAGYEVRTASNGEDAVRIAQEFLPDAAVFDIGMPGMDGYAVARRIRASDRGREMFLIAATGWGRSEDRRAALDAGFDHHLIKPVTASDIQRLLAAGRPVANESGI
ncbi:MAG: hybrid sensor histidine kinase/response regulator [Janthinobacterium lividum]